MQGFYRCHVLFLDVLQLLLEERHDHAAALLSLSAWATLRAAEDSWQWINARLLVPTSDPFHEGDEGAEGYELIAIAQHPRALATRKTVHR